MAEENTKEVKTEEHSALEMPEVVPGMAPIDYPEISEFLQKMKIKTGLFGYQKEDVLEKMQQLNSMYQSRAQQMRDQSRGQLKQMKKQQQDEVIEIRGHFEKMQDEMKQEWDKEFQGANIRAEESGELKKLQHLFQEDSLRRLEDAARQVEEWKQEYRSMA